MNEQKLTNMIDYFRSRLAEEQLRLADAITTNDELRQTISNLERELEGYRVPTETEGSNNSVVSPK